MSIQDDKAQYVVPFILTNLQSHQAKHPHIPFFIGLNGCQGAGKSVLVDILRTTLQSAPHNLPTVVFSLDDLYLTRSDQLDLAKANPHNPLLQHRGQPSTHDVPLALDVFRKLKQGQPTKIPQYNKAAFNGAGDREKEDMWKPVNVGQDPPVKVVLFEGWCVGFRPLSEDRLREKHDNAVREAGSDSHKYAGRLGYNSLESVETINEALKQYDEITDQFDAFIHIDAADPLFVYKWRLQQEEGLRAKRGSGMTDEQVEIFVNGYYPAYELYTETLREGVFKPQQTGFDVRWQGKQLRLVVGFDRKVIKAIPI